jgi:CRP/FNR family transcriptional regulator
VVCQSCEARHKGVCGGLESAELSYLAKNTSKKAYRRGEEILAAGEKLDRYSNILSGVVKLVKLLPDGRQQIVGLQFAPDFVGQLFADTSNISAEAATDVRLCTFPRQVLESLAEQSPAMEHRLLQQTLRGLDDARDWMLTLGRKTAKEKVASFLMLISAYSDPERKEFETPFTIDLPLKRGDIADYLSLTVETVCRQLTNLRKAKIIDVPNRQHIIVLDLVRLRALAEQTEIVDV